MKNNSKNMIDEKELDMISGGSSNNGYTREEIYNYFKVRDLRAGIFERIYMSQINKDDEELILVFFPSVYRFLAINRFVGNRDHQEVLNSL